MTLRSAISYIKTHGGSSQVKIYLAGPMRGIVFFNFPAFDMARDRLTSRGFEVISPADIDRSHGVNPDLWSEDQNWFDLESFGLSIPEIIDRDIAAMKSCNSIYMLRGWQRSKGARAEKAIAEWMDMTVIYEDDDNG